MKKMGERFIRNQGIIYGGLLVVALLISINRGLPLWMGFVVSLFLISGALLWQKQSVSDLFKCMKAGILSVKRIYIMIILIGFNVALWISSGVVPSMIYYGFEVVGHVNFLLFAFLMSALMALFMGTGLGTLSTVGVALFALGSVMDFPPPLLLGAILSGAYVADRLSPLSALVQFTCATHQIKYKAYAMSVARTMLPSFILTAVLCIFLGGHQGDSSPLLISQIGQYKQDLSNQFLVHPLLMLVPLVVLLEVVRSGDSQRTLYLGTGFGVILTLVLQGQSLWQVLLLMVRGFRAEKASEIIHTLEIGGGWAMLEVIVIIMLGMALSSLYEHFGWFDPLINRLIKKAKSPQSLVRRTALLSIGLDALTCDQTIGIVIPSKTCVDSFKGKGFSRVDLASLVANSGTALAPLMPWNVNAIIILSVTGIGAVDYGPYMILNWSTLLLMLVFQILSKVRAIHPERALDKS